jgi:hypothetical protein
MGLETEISEGNEISTYQIDTCTSTSTCFILQDRSEWGGEWERAPLRVYKSPPSIFQVDPDQS